MKRSVGSFVSNEWVKESSEKKEEMGFQEEEIMRGIFPRMPGIFPTRFLNCNNFFGSQKRRKIKKKSSETCKTKSFFKLCESTFESHKNTDILGAMLNP